MYKTLFEYILKQYRPIKTKLLKISYIFHIKSFAVIESLENIFLNKLN